MNTGLRPLPRSMPFLVRARLMVQRGEARTISEATKAMRSRSRDYGRTTLTAKDRAECRAAHAVEARLPYADN